MSKKITDKKEKMKDFYTDEGELKTPTAFDLFLERLEFSAPVMFFYRLLNGNGKFCGIKYIPKEIKWAIQRATRGYSDCDLWNLNNFLGGMIVKTLKAFKGTNRSGYPGAYSMRTLPSGKMVNVPEKQAIKKWENDLQDMIDGFSFITNADEKFDEVLKKVNNDYQKANLVFKKKYKEATEKAQKFVQHFGELWD